MKAFRSVFPLALLILLFSGCRAVPTQDHPPTVDTSRIHTQVAATIFAAAAPSPRVTPSPALVEMAVAAAASTPEPTPTESPTPTAPVISVPTMENVPLLQGYGSYGARFLEQPAAVTRDGITLQVEQVIVFQDQIELVYTVRNIPHEILFDPVSDGEENSCGGPDSYANLMLPDGEIIVAENYLLDGKAYDTIQGPFARTFLIHIYRASVPQEVREMKLLLQCIGLARLDSSPLHWEVPFRVVPANEKR